ncbi:amino acid/polyamine transporter I [Schizothecium vesticola]|uniref:Amino acid/polyamine transporter I n=1 Tax=Schizothecium vesticola TaxID=314040 RepID=A0AA40EWZ9_9PEZI|nr:amino acid/polyamine transporter I [Schizothecium vesticola]
MPFTIVCLILNRTIGSGIFIQPINVLFHTNSSAVAILVWIVGGLIVFALMLCWLELALIVPIHFIDGHLHSIIQSGGDKNYLECIYKRPRFLITCVFGVTYIIFGNLAAEAMQFGGQECFSRVKVLVKVLVKVFGWAVGVVTLCAVITATTTRKWFLGVNNLLAVAKIIFLVTTAIVGIACGTRNGNTCRNISWYIKGDKTTSVGDIVPALFLVMYAYTGFDQPFYALAEVRRQRRVFASSVAAAMLYLLIILPLVNIGYMCAITYENNGTLPKNIAVAIFSLLAPGDSLAAERAVSAILATFILGSIMAQTFTSSKVIQEIAKEGILPYSKFFATGKRSLLSRLRALWRRNRPVEETSKRTERTPVAATFLYWVPTVVLLVLVGMIEKPSVSYKLLVLLRTFSVTAILGLATCAGLLYLKVDSWVVGIGGRNWKSHVQWHPWLNPIPVCVATLALGFLIFWRVRHPGTSYRGQPAAVLGCTPSRVVCPDSWCCLVDGTAIRPVVGEMEAGGNQTAFVRAGL